MDAPKIPRTLPLGPKWTPWQTRNNSLSSTPVQAALLAQLHGGPNPMQQGQAAYTAMGSYARVVPTIVFQGTRDTTVNPVNGDQVIQQRMQTDHLASNNLYNASFSSPAST